MCIIVTRNVSTNGKRDGFWGPFQPCNPEALERFRERRGQVRHPVYAGPFRRYRETGEALFKEGALVTVLPALGPSDTFGRACEEIYLEHSKRDSFPKIPWALYLVMNHPHIAKEGARDLLQGCLHARRLTGAHREDIEVVTGGTLIGLFKYFVFGEEAMRCGKGDSLTLQRAEIELAIKELAK